MVNLAATPAQQRRAEDARGTNRDGARTRFKESLARGRAKGAADGKGKSK